MVRKNDVRQEAEREYRFTLRYQLADDDSDHDALAERLAEAGCDDALLGIGVSQRLALEFTRNGRDAMTAIAGALAAVRRAVPGACLIEAAPDLVGLSDVAQIVGMSRQNVRKLMIAHRDSFPLPVHAGAAGVWHLAEVLAWFQSRGVDAIDPLVVDVAIAALQVNLAKAATHAIPSAQRQLRALV